MKTEIFKTNEAVASYCGAMETRDHFKNGRSSKSYKSKGYSLGLITTLVSILFSIVACSSPEKEGKNAAQKVAKEICNCAKEGGKAVQKVIQKEQSNLKKHSFKTRADVSEKRQEIENLLNDIYSA